MREDRIGNVLLLRGNRNSNYKQTIFIPWVTPPCVRYFHSSPPTIAAASMTSTAAATGASALTMAADRLAFFTTFCLNCHPDNYFLIKQTTTTLWRHPATNYVNWVLAGDGQATGWTREHEYKSQDHNRAHIA